MPLARLIYISENQIDPSRGSLVAQLGSILSVSNRNNRAKGITGALVFDDKWFVQALEGEKRAIWKTFERIAEDDRHSDTLLIEMTDVEERVFGNWWMGLATRTAETASAFAPYTHNGFFVAEEMSGKQVLSLMTSLSRLGLRREMLADAA